MGDAYDALAQNKTLPQVGRALRYSEGKLDYTYLEKELVNGIAEVMRFGAGKYERGNWALSINTEEHDEYQQSILGCMMRHMFAILFGELDDPESGLPHISHVATNAMMFAAYSQRYEGEIDASQV